MTRAFRVACADHDRMAVTRSHAGREMPRAKCPMRHRDAKREETNQWITPMSKLNILARAPSMRQASGAGSGIALRLAATGLFAVMSLCVRLASFEAPVGQIVFYRSALALPPIVAYLFWRRQFPWGLRTRRPGGHLMRSLFGCTAMFFPSSRWPTCLWPSPRHSASWRPYWSCRLRYLPCGNVQVASSSARHSAALPALP